MKEARCTGCIERAWCQEWWGEHSLAQLMETVEVEVAEPAVRSSS